jgi:hypothetical protein
MVFHTIYLKDLKNDAGYMDVVLENDQLFRNFMQFLEVRIVPVRANRLADPANPGAHAGKFAINFADVSAMTIRQA